MTIDVDEGILQILICNHGNITNAVANTNYKPHQKEFLSRCADSNAKMFLMLVTPYSSKFGSSPTSKSQKMKANLTTAESHKCMLIGNFVNEHVSSQK